MTGHASWSAKAGHCVLQQLRNEQSDCKQILLRLRGSVTLSFGNSSASTEGLPSVSDSHTIASTASATAANLTALAQHSLSQLDHSPSQSFTLGQKQPVTQHRPSRLFRAEAHIPPLTRLHQLMTGEEMPWNPN